MDAIKSFEVKVTYNTSSDDLAELEALAGQVKKAAQAVREAKAFCEPIIAETTEARIEAIKKQCLPLMKLAKETDCSADITVDIPYAAQKVCSHPNSRACVCLRKNGVTIQHYNYTLSMHTTELFDPLTEYNKSKLASPDSIINNWDATNVYELLKKNLAGKMAKAAEIHRKNAAYQYNQLKAVTGNNN